MKTKLMIIFASERKDEKGMEVVTSKLAMGTGVMVYFLFSYVYIKYFKITERIK